MEPEPSSSIELYYLHTFHVVAEQRGYSRAARVLRLSQPAVSARIRALERHIGARLFEVRHRQVFLTDEGQVLYQYTQRIFNLLREAEREVAATRQLTRGHLALAASTTIGVYLLPPLLGEFANSHPQLTISLEVDTTAGTLHRVLASEAALGLVEAPVRHAEIEAHSFASDELVLIAAPQHPLAQTPEVPLDRLHGQPLLRREPGSGTQAIIDAALEAQGVQMSTAMALGSTESLKQAAMAGLGVAWVSHVTVRREVAAGHLRILRTPGLTLERPLYALWLRDRTLPPAVAAFRALIMARAAALVSG